MRKYYFFTFASLLVLLTFYSLANAMEEKPLKITKIKTNYPMHEHAVNLPDHSTSLNISVDAEDAAMVRFYFDTTETEMDDTKQLIKEDSDPGDGLNCVMDYDSTEGFARQIVIEAISKSGDIKTERFSVYKGIDTNK